MNIRRAFSERKPEVTSPRAEVGEIDTRAPFQSVKAAVSLFGEVAVSKDKRSTPRKPKLSSENVIDKETQLMLALKELNNIKQKLDSAETTKDKAMADLERSKRTLHDLSAKLKTVTEAKQMATDTTDAIRNQAKQLEKAKSKKHLESSARQQELQDARDLYASSATQLDSAKQELNKIRQEFDSSLEAKLAAFQQAADAQRAGKMQSDRVSELSSEIPAMKEAILEMEFATQEALQQQAEILEGKNVIEQSYKNAKEEIDKNIEELKKDYEPDLVNNLEVKLGQTTEEVKYLQDEMKKVHASEMDSVRVITTELNEATRALQRVAEEEGSLRNLVCSLRMELEDVIAEQEKHKKIQQEDEAKIETILAEARKIRHEAEETKKKAEELKEEAETARKMAEEDEKKLEIALIEVENAKEVEKKAVEEMKGVSSQESSENGKINIPVEDFESMKKKADESGPTAEKKVEAALIELKAIHENKDEAAKKLEANLKAIQEIKAATEIALKSVESAEAAKRVVEGELGKWRQQEEKAAA